MKFTNLDKLHRSSHKDHDIHNESLEHHLHNQILRCHSRVEKIRTHLYLNKKVFRLGEACARTGFGPGVIRYIPQNS